MLSMFRMRSASDPELRRRRELKATMQFLTDWVAVLVDDGTLFDRHFVLAANGTGVHQHAAGEADENMCIPHS